MLSRFSRVQLFATSQTVTCQAPLSLGFSRQEYWSGLPLSSPGDLPDPGIEPGSPALQVDCLPAELPGKPPPLGRTGLNLPPSETLKVHSPGTRHLSGTAAVTDDSRAISGGSVIWHRVPAS